MKTKILLTLMLICLASCCDKKEDDVEYYEIELHNKILENEIWKYMEMIKARDNHRTDCDSVVFCVSCKSMNDSIDRFVVSAIISPDIIHANPFQFICRIKGEVVFFQMALAPLPYSTSDAYFRLSDDSYEKLLRRHFPVAYAAIKNHICSEILYEPELCFITMKKDSLIESYLERGLPQDGFWFRSFSEKMRPDCPPTLFDKHNKGADESR